MSRRQAAERFGVSAPVVKYIVAAKLKAHLRKAAERSVDALWNRIGALLEQFTPKECGNFFAAAGYEPL